MTDSRLPVTIITGFLGAGKTTLLNNLIQKYPEKKFAIIENEFGQVGIDGALIVEGSDTIFELSNGCICCSLNSDLNETLAQLTAMGERINHVLVETTGIADPTTVVKSFISTPDVQQHYRIDSVVCLADAEYLDDLLGDEPEVRNQIAVSDLVLLNKIDLVDSAWVDKLHQVIAAINPMAKICNTKYADVSHIDVVDTNAYVGAHVAQSVLRFDYQHKVAVYSNVMSPGWNSQSEDVTTHRHNITSEGFVLKGCFDIAKFNAWMQGFLYFNSNTVYRVKGILCFDGYDDYFVFHAVRGTFMMEKFEGQLAGDKCCKLVFIGKLLDRDVLSESLDLLMK